VTRLWTRARRLLTLTVGATLLLSAHAEARTIHWSGYDWTVRTSVVREMPGRNLWSDSRDNVRVLRDGRLRLSPTKVGRSRYSSEIMTSGELGLGRYQWVIDTDLRPLHKNRVVGLFTYPSGLNRSGEQDIEFSRWGSLRNPLGWVVSWQGQQERLFSRFRVGPPPYTCSITWRVTVAQFACSNAKRVLVASAWPAVQPALTHAHLSYWDFRKRLPDPRVEMPVVFRSFKFTPLDRL
jgi:hypothetical protein